MLTGPKLRAIVNLLSDPLQSHAAANILTEEAKRRSCLVADLLAEALRTAPPTQPAVPALRFATSWSRTMSAYRHAAAHLTVDITTSIHSEPQSAATAEFCR